MKNLYSLIIILFFSLTLNAQESDCDDPNKEACCKAGNGGIVAITPLAELKCKEKKAHLYNIFPKIPIYKGFLFNEVKLCDALANSTALMEFEYCIAKTRQHMTVTITDFADPFFKTEAGKAQQNFFQVLFDAGASPILKTYPSKNKKFEKSLIAMPEGDRVKYVSFEGLKDNRFYIHIVIEGDKFQLATEVDTFLADYINSFDFKI